MDSTTAGKVVLALEILSMVNAEKRSASMPTLGMEVVNLVVARVVLVGSVVTTHTEEMITCKVVVQEDNSDKAAMDKATTMTTKEDRTRVMVVNHQALPTEEPVGMAV